MSFREFMGIFSFCETRHVPSQVSATSDLPPSERLSPRGNTPNYRSSVQELDLRNHHLGEQNGVEEAPSSPTNYTATGDKGGVKPPPTWSAETGFVFQSPDKRPDVVSTPTNHHEFNLVDDFLTVFTLLMMSQPASYLSVAIVLRSGL